jgi:chromosomal replication initiator protein
VGNYVIDHDPLARVALFSSERFVNDFIRAARHSSLDDFRKKYREGYDVALVDDLYATFGIEGSQEELFGVLRHFEKKRKRVVIATSSLPGKDQPHTSSEFMRLLGAATKVKIGAPDYETRTKFIEQYLVKQASFIAACESSRGSLSPKDVTVAILALAGPGFRELEGALLRLETMASINGNDWKSAIEELKIR